MWKKAFISIVIVLIGAPLVISFTIQREYAHYDALAKRYDCYPFLKCNANFDRDEVRDLIEVVDKPSGEGSHNFRLKFFLIKQGSREEILDLEYNNADDTFRTHVALFEEHSASRVIIYDTVNPDQYYYWDGKKLAPNHDPQPEEKEIRKAMALSDEAGGLYKRIVFELFGVPLLALYYFFLSVILIGISFYYLKYVRIKLK